MNPLVDLGPGWVNHAAVSSAPPLFFDVCVEPHDALPDGLMLRFKATPGALPSSITRVRHTPEDSDESRWFRIEGLDADDRPVPARAVTVEDSAAGLSVLVFGGEHGLRLFADDPAGRGPDAAPGTATASALAETHLLLPPGACP